MMDAEHWRSTMQAVGETEHKILGVVLVGGRDLRGGHRRGLPPRRHRLPGAPCPGRRASCRSWWSACSASASSGWSHARPPSAPASPTSPSPPARRTTEVKAYAMAVINTIKELLPLNPLYVEELRMFLDRFGPEDPSHLADFAASLTTSTKDAAPGGPGGHRRCCRAWRRCWCCSTTNWNWPGPAEDPPQRRGADAEAAARVLSARAAQGDPEGAGPRQGRPHRRAGQVPGAPGQADADRGGRRSGSTRRWRSWRCSRPARPEYAVTRNYLDWITLLPWGMHSAGQARPQARPRACSTATTTAWRT